MPYKKGQKWNAQVRKNGKRKEKLFNKKKEAVAWEVEMKRKFIGEWDEEKIHSTCLFDWANLYLKFSKAKHVEKTFKEKRKMFKTFFSIVDSHLSVDELTPSDVLDYTQEQKKDRSGYAANKDRKNLIAG